MMKQYSLDDLVQRIDSFYPAGRKIGTELLELQSMFGIQVLKIEPRSQMKANTELDKIMSSFNIYWKYTNEDIFTSPVEGQSESVLKHYNRLWGMSLLKPVLDYNAKLKEGQDFMLFVDRATGRKVEDIFLDHICSHGILVEIAEDLSEITLGDPLDGRLNELHAHPDGNPWHVKTYKEWRARTRGAKPLTIEAPYINRLDGDILR